MKITRFQPEYSCGTKKIQILSGQKSNSYFCFAVITINTVALNMTTTPNQIIL